MRNIYKKYREAKQRSEQSIHSFIRYLEELEAQIIPIPEDHQRSTILGALHPWIEAQVSNQLELPKSKSDLIELAFKVESIAVYRRQDSEIGINNGEGGKGEKRVRSDIDSYQNNKSGPVTS